MKSVSRAGQGGGESFIYGPDGRLLLRVNADGSKSLFPFADQEITASAGGGLSAKRSYPFAGATIAVRTYTASSSSMVYTPASYQGTVSVQRVEGGAATSVRRYDPYGNPRGTTPQGWQGSNGFLGASAAAAQTSTHTGLVHLGAREYNPLTGTFASVDPVTDPHDPAQLNAYTYAHNSPVTASDPDGLAMQGATDRIGDTVPNGPGWQPNLDSYFAEGGAYGRNQSEEFHGPVAHPSSFPSKAGATDGAVASDWYAATKHARERAAEALHQSSWQEVLAGPLADMARMKMSEFLCADYGDRCVAAVALGALQDSAYKVRIVSPLATDATEASEMVRQAASKALAQGWTKLLGNLSEGEKEAMGRRPYLSSAFMGTALHRETAAILAASGQFTYNSSRGVDFTHKSGVRVELTTEKGVRSHRARGGEYMTSDIVTYSPDGRTKIVGRQ